MTSLLCSECKTKSAIYQDPKTQKLYCGYVCWIGDKNFSENVIKERKAKNLPDLTSTQGIRTFIKMLKSNQLELEDAELKTKIGLNDFLIDPCNQHEFIKKLKTLGSGTYGTSKEIKVNGLDEVSLKLSKMDITDVNLFSGGFVERRMVEYLSREFLERNVTPHLPPYLGGAVCKLYGNIEVGAFNFIVTKRAKYGDIGQYLETYFEKSEDIIRQIIFEICYTLTAIHILKPTFRHNDIKPNNILAMVGPNNGYTLYDCSILSEDQLNYYIPNSGVRSILWDFDFSSIRGTIENQKTVYLQYTKPYANISTKNPAGYDLMLLVAYLYKIYKVRLSPEFRKELAETWGQDILNLKQYPHAPYIRLDTTKEMPSPQDVLLNSPLFNIYRVKMEDDGVVVDRYSLTKNPTFKDKDFIRLHEKESTMFEKLVVPLAFGGSFNFNQIISAQIWMKYQNQQYPRLPYRPSSVEYIMGLSETVATQTGGGFKRDVLKKRLETTITIYVRAEKLFGGILPMYRLLVFFLIFISLKPFLSYQIESIRKILSVRRQYSWEEVKQSFIQINWLNI